ncbi:MAG: hypothetical protein UFJ02_00845 [Prevotella sp.]|nr:hypothetical protein [Prevotella sp.]
MTMAKASFRRFPRQGRKPSFDGGGGRWRGSVTQCPAHLVLSRPPTRKSSKMILGIILLYS